MPLAVLSLISVPLGSPSSLRYTDAAVSPAHRGLGKDLNGWDRWSTFSSGTLDTVALQAHCVTGMGDVESGTNGVRRTPVWPRMLE